MKTMEPSTKVSFILIYKGKTVQLALSLEHISLDLVIILFKVIWICVKPRRRWVLPPRPVCVHPSLINSSSSPLVQESGVWGEQGTLWLFHFLLRGHRLYGLSQLMTVSGNTLECAHTHTRGRMLFIIGTCLKHMQPHTHAQREWKRDSLTTHQSIVSLSFWHRGTHCRGSHQ